MPVVAAAHGTTAGGGLGILLSSDYAVVGAHSKLGSLYANIGLSPDLSVSAQLARAIGERRALQLVLQDRMLSAREAVEWGLVAEVVDLSTGSGVESGTDARAEADAVRARAEEIARFGLAGATQAYGQAKHLVRAQPERSFAEQLEAEAGEVHPVNRHRRDHVDARADFDIGRHQRFVAHGVVHTAMATRTVVHPAHAHIGHGQRRHFA